MKQLKIFLGVEVKLNKECEKGKEAAQTEIGRKNAMEKLWK